MKNFKKIGALLFISSYLIIGLSFSTSVSAANTVEFTPQVGIPGTEFQQGVGTAIGKTVGETISSDLIARYVSAFYKWGLSIVGVLAVLMLMAGGLIWLTSGGDSGKIGQAKKMIGGSLLGSLLLVGAYFFLNTINPDLTKLPAIELTVINKKDVDASKDTSDGIIDNEKNIPSDAEIKWKCLTFETQSCEDTVPPTMNINASICREKLGEHPSCNGFTWCCAKSAADQKSIDDYCKNQDTGTACNLTSTSVSGSGYCRDGKCIACKKLGSSCSGPLANHECVGESSLCGDPGDGTSDCNCNIVGGNCTCDATWK